MHGARGTQQATLSPRWRRAAAAAARMRTLRPLVFHHFPRIHDEICCYGNGQSRRDDWERPVVRGHNTKCEEYIYQSVVVFLSLCLCCCCCVFVTCDTARALFIFQSIFRHHHHRHSDHHRTRLTHSMATSAACTQRSRRHAQP